MLLCHTKAFRRNILIQDLGFMVEVGSVRALLTISPFPKYGKVSLSVHPTCIFNHANKNAGIFLNDDDVVETTMCRLVFNHFISIPTLPLPLGSKES